MKGRILKIGAALIAMSACLAMAQDKDRDHDRDKARNHHIVHAKVTQPKTRTYRIRRHGGTQTVTYYQQRARPGYHPRRIYSDQEWARRVRDARNHRHHKVKHHKVKHDNGLHRGWYIGKGNPHRTGTWLKPKSKHKTNWLTRDRDRDGDRDKGNWLKPKHKSRDRDGGKGNWLKPKHKSKDKDNDGDKDRGHGRGHGDEMSLMPASGFQLASYQTRDNNWLRQQKRRKGGDRRHNDRRARYAAGHYSSTTRWTQRDEEFVIRYVINLGGDGHARLEATSVQDRNMPNNGRNTDSHGDILRYMHSGHDVIQTGSWDQNGDSVTIHLNRMQYGRKSNSKNETLRGRLNGNGLKIDSFDRNFYGDRFDTTFDKD
jgi:hypothetical protein